MLCSFAEVEHCFILGDVTYGACCVDDFSAAALGADFLVHYGHSCLVPVDVTKVPCMYIFVDIKIDTEHLIESIRWGTIAFNCACMLRTTASAMYPKIKTLQAAPAELSFAFMAYSSAFAHTHIHDWQSSSNPSSVLCQLPILVCAVLFRLNMFV